jgi:hypothetical protein
LDSPRSRAASTRVFREVNERIRALADGPPATRREFICECANPDCAELVPLTLAEFDALPSVVAHRHAATASARAS